MTDWDVKVIWMRERCVTSAKWSGDSLVECVLGALPGEDVPVEQDAEAPPVRVAVHPTAWWAGSHLVKRPDE